MKKIIIIAAILLILFAGLFLITYDFNSYSEASKNIPCEEDGIIFSIVTFDGKSEAEPFLMCLGHSWVAVDNRTDHPVMIQDYALQPNEIITIGAWAVTGHWGVIFNAEPEFRRLYGRYDGMESLSINIDEAQLDTVNAYIEAHNEWWFTRNCSYWASQLWNEIAPEEFHVKKQTILYTPEQIQKSFRECKNVEINKDFSRAKGAFFYIDGVRTEMKLCQSY